MAVYNKQELAEIKKEKGGFVKNHCSKKQIRLIVN
jgi:hypothetical protein